MTLPHRAKLAAPRLSLLAVVPLVGRGSASSPATATSTSNRAVYSSPLIRDEATTHEPCRGRLTETNAEAIETTVCYPGAVSGRSAASLPRSALDHLDALYRVARRLTGRDDDAEDLVQETYARALAGWSSFTADSNLRAWLFRILRNAYVDSYRRARTNPVRVNATEELPVVDSPSAREPLRGDAELERLRGAVAADIETALACLPDDARAIILLDLEGFSGDELAEVFGCAVGTVKSRLSRARQVLRELLQDYRE
jgi:RNA polymerase sigma-70 factor (ECF subfamily)